MSILVGGFLRPEVLRRHDAQPVVPPCALARALYDAPSLINEERRDEGRRNPRKQGVILPYDYMFGDYDRVVESFRRVETIRPIAVAAHRCQGSPERSADGQALYSTLWWRGWLGDTEPWGRCLAAVGRLGKP
ncbi:hypothetical protein GMOD_00001079 [Pyrenophora seminiperda CCB06]|uniref:Uncharacterized protein n=1 Tax=Pyrenophora seminiperda CCB06 TaxID=1302712 RepID=A0A3M7LY93_9PLEO|nr:hypothetical protein GMOD_00001079 [Pyrenophora seminiperda CCB06]